jgi:hypothetical protein
MADVPMLEKRGVLWRLQYEKGSGWGYSWLESTYEKDSHSQDIREHLRPWLVI